MSNPIFYHQDDPKFSESSENESIGTLAFFAREYLKETICIAKELIQLTDVSSSEFFKPPSTSENLKTVEMKAIQMAKSHPESLVKVQNIIQHCLDVDSASSRSFMLVRRFVHTAGLALLYLKYFKDKIAVDSLLQKRTAIKQCRDAYEHLDSYILKGKDRTTKLKKHWFAEDTKNRSLSDPTGMTVKKDTNGQKYVEIGNRVSINQLIPLLEDALAQLIVLSARIY